MVKEIDQFGSVLEEVIGGQLSQGWSIGGQIESGFIGALEEQASLELVEVIEGQASSGSEEIKEDQQVQYQ